MPRIPPHCFRARRPLLHRGQKLRSNPLLAQREQHRRPYHGGLHTHHAHFVAISEVGTCACSPGTGIPNRRVAKSACLDAGYPSPIVHFDNVRRRIVHAIDGPFDTIGGGDR